MPALAHTALKINWSASPVKMLIYPRKRRFFAAFCLVWPSLVNFSDRA